GCYVAPDGTPDGCNQVGNPVYHLPWACNVTYPCTQGNNGDICGSNNGDHTGLQQYAWDFGIPRHTPVLAARAGRVSAAHNTVGPGQQCYDGCTQPFGTPEFQTCCNNCLTQANWVNVNHGDTTVAEYYHLDQVTATLGQMVQQGDVLGYSGTSGCSSVPHLHFMLMGIWHTSSSTSVTYSFN